MLSITCNSIALISRFLLKLRTGIPSDPHSPTALLNHLTAPDVVIWSSVLASAAVPGILPPIPVMIKKADGTLEPSAFGHRWKDGRFVVIRHHIDQRLIGGTSLRTDIPLKALNLHFGVCSFARSYLYAILLTTMSCR